MKRYWKIISLCMLTVLIIATFYIQAGFAAKEDIKVEFETLSGDDTELEQISFHGEMKKGNLYQSSIFSEKDTVNLNNMSFFGTLNGAYLNPTYKRLVEEHKGFMRGKIVSTENYYEDVNLLAYAEIEVESAGRLSFEIDVLNKQSGKNNSFNADFPEKGKYDWANVAEVQARDGKLHVLVRCFGNGTNEINIATFNLNDQKLEKIESIHSTNEDKNYWSDIRIISNYRTIGYERYIMFYDEKQPKEFAYEESSMEIDNENMDTTLMVYDIETNELQEVPKLKETLGSIHSSSIHDSVLYVPSQSEDGFVANQYNIENQAWGDKVHFDWSHAMGENASGTFTKLINGKYYIVSAKENGPHHLLIWDVSTGKIAYEGLIKVKEDGQILSDYRLYIFELILDQ